MLSYSIIMKNCHKKASRNKTTKYRTKITHKVINTSVQLSHTKLHKLSAFNWLGVIKANQSGRRGFYCIFTACNKYGDKICPVRREYESIMLYVQSVLPTNGKSLLKVTSEELQPYNPLKTSLNRVFKYLCCHLARIRSHRHEMCKGI